MKAPNFITKGIFTLITVLVTTFTSIGYSSLTEELGIDGTGNASSQSGIFITEAKISANTGADLTKSSVSQNGACILTINTTLSDSNVNSTLSYKVTFYNSTDDYYVYYTNSSTRTNKSYITYSISGISKQQTIIAPKSYLTCTTTYKYTVDPTTSNITSSDGVVTYTFTKCYNVTYENFSSTTNLITYANPYDDFTVTLDNTTPVAVEVGGTNLSMNNFSFSSKTLTVGSSHISGDIKIRKKTKSTFSNILKNGSFENSSLTTGNALTGWAFNSDGQYWGRTASALGSYAAYKRVCPYNSQHITQRVTLSAGNVYYFYYYAMAESGTQPVNSDINLNGTSVTGTVTVNAVNGDNGGYRRGSAIFTASSSSSAYYVNIAWNANSILVHIDGVAVVNLTQMFGAGEEPSKEWCDNWIMTISNDSVETYI